MARLLNAPKLSPFQSSANYFLVAGVFSFAHRAIFWARGEPASVVAPLLQVMPSP